MDIIIGISAQNTSGGCFQTIFFSNDINSSHKKFVRESMTVNKINKAPVLIYEIKSMNLTLRFQHTSYYYHTLMLILNIYICKYAFLYEPIGQRKRSILCDFYFCNYDHHTCLSFDDCNIVNVKTSLYYDSERFAILKRKYK